MRLDHLLSKETSRGWITVEFLREEKSLRTKTFPVAMRFWETPVPIPNTMVKTKAADGTMLETAWESRWLPEPLKETGLL